MKVYSKIELNNYHQSLTYDDISLIPIEISRIRSRNEALTSCDFLGVKLSLPVISSPMDTVTGIEMAKELTNLGCIGILNRFDSSLDFILKDENLGEIRSVSVALNCSEELIEKLAAKNYLICIDTANKNRGYKKEILCEYYCRQYCPRRFSSTARR